MIQAGVEMGWGMKPGKSWVYTMIKKPQSTPKSPPRAEQELLGAGEGTQNIGKHHQGCLEGPAHVPAEQESEVEAPPAPAEI